MAATTIIYQEHGLTIGLTQIVSPLALLAGFVWSAKRYTASKHQPMAERLTVEAAIAQIEHCSQPSLIAIDGLPCSGKSTIVERLGQRVEVACIHIDEFVLPERDWPSRNKPFFPFKYIRYEAFLRTVEALATVGETSFYPFDWNTLTISESLRTVTLTGFVVIEGVSSLNSRLCSLTHGA